MTWLAGAKPFQTSSDGSEVTVNLTEDKGVKTFTDFWQKLLDEDLLDTKTAGWSEDWFKGMVDGTIASLFTGAWMPANLANSAADGAGKWRVTQMPTADGSTTNSENGGSSLAVLASTKKADAAYQSSSTPTTATAWPPVWPAVHSRLTRPPWSPTPSRTPPL